MFKFKNNNFGGEANSSDDEEGGRGGMMMQRFQEDNDEKINTSSAAPSSQFIYIQSVQDKSVSKVYIGQDAKNSEKLYTLPHLCYKINATYLCGNLDEVIVGVTSNMRLYLNDKLFSNECTSFFLNQSFLAFVNSTSGLSHELFIYDLTRSLPKPQTP